jgi:hypothetical protein
LKKEDTNVKAEINDGGVRMERIHTISHEGIQGRGSKADTESR